MILFSPANTSAKSPGLDADGGMEIAAPQANTSFGTLFSNTSNTITSSNTTNGKKFVFIFLKVFNFFFSLCR